MALSAQPMFDNIILKRDTNKKTSASGLEVGDRVAFAKVSAQVIKVDECPVLFIREVDVYAILREV